MICTKKLLSEFSQLFDVKIFRNFHEDSLCHKKVKKSWHPKTLFLSLKNSNMKLFHICFHLSSIAPHFWLWTLYELWKVPDLEVTCFHSLSLWLLCFDGHREQHCWLSFCSMPKQEGNHRPARLEEKLRKVWFLFKKQLKSKIIHWLFF